MGQCEDDIKIPCPVVHSILIRIRVYQLYILRQIAAAEVRLKYEDDIRNFSISNLYSRR